jgi:hypothetical protein
MHRLVGFAFFVVSLAIAGGALHLSRGHPATVDYSPLAECIGNARYRYPLDDKHQELVNAMYTCGIYRLPVGWESDS